MELRKKDRRRAVRGHFRFRDVSFYYLHGHRVLHNICFEIPAGTRVGIVGAKGSGKTTLINLLTKAYDPADGQILMDGVDLRDYQLADLRRQFSIVQQERRLISGTVAANIAYVCPEASRSEIVQAARMADAHEFILRLPNGYDTPISERGARLSSGERQRIAIARAFLKDAPVLILSEPARPAEKPSEELIVAAAMERLIQGRTSFIIANRLRTLEDCDRVLVLKDGRLTMVAHDLGQPRTARRCQKAPPVQNLGPVLVH